MKLRKYISVSLLGAVVLSLLSPFMGLFTASAAQSLDFGNAGVNLYKDPSGDPLKRYAVGFMSYDIWSDSSGAWTTKKPGDTVSTSELKHTYTFPATNRIIKSVTVKPFVASSKYGEYFNGSRNTDNYNSYQPFFSTNTGGPYKGTTTGEGTNSVTIDVSMTGKLESANTFDIREMSAIDPCSGCNSNVKGFRYYYPVLFEFTLEGQYEVHSVATDGTSLDSKIPIQKGIMKVGSTYPPAPGTNPNYVYAGKYKKSTNGNDPQTNPFMTDSATFTYDGSFDQYIINYYYEPKPTSGQIKITHVDEQGHSLDGVAGLKDSTKTLIDGQTYSFQHDEPTAGSGYTYNGYTKATNGGEADISSLTPAASYNLGKYDLKTFAPLVKLAYVYHLENKGEVHIRHMVRNGPTGTFSQEKEDIIPVAIFPFSGTYKADSQYGKALASNSSYITYIDYQGALKDQPINLTVSQTDAYISFYYEKNIAGQVQIRHMVREGPTGAYKQAQLIVEDASALPFNKTYGFDSQYGDIKGSNLSYVYFSDLVTPMTNQPVYLDATRNKSGFVSFFYETPAKFTGDFDVVPSSIAYKDSFKLQPRDFLLNGCPYKYHYYKIERDGTTWTGPAVYGMTSDSSYTYGNYPWNIGLGYHSVYMKIVTDCGVSDWIGPEVLNVSGPANNNPPSFKIGFVHSYDNKHPLQEVVINTVLDLIYIDDPAVPTPHDPDGDDVIFMGFDTAASSDPFVQSIPSNSYAYIDGQHSLKMDTLGYHRVCGMMRDTFGATSTTCTMIKVVPENPVPIPGCPVEVIANHPVDMTKFDASQSYSPMGRTINHSKDEWTNRQTTYTNDSNEDIHIVVSLDVYDDSGLKSIQAGTCTITVKPDLPPIAKLLVPSVGLRGETVTIPNLSTSPDGDQIIKAEYKYKYDTNNNGFYDNDWQDIPGTLEELTFIPNKVGRYLFYVMVTEEYGMIGDTSGWTALSYTLNVSNLAPEVSFDVEGKNPQPDLDLPMSYPAQDILNTWDLFDMNTGDRVANPKINWSIRNGTLEGGTGKQPEHQYSHFYSERYFNNDFYNDQVEPTFDFGYGANGLSPYRSAAGSSTVSSPLLDANNYPIYLNNNPVFRTNAKYFYFLSDSNTIYAMNKSKIVNPQLANPTGFNITYSYPNGSPYDFMLAYPNTSGTRVSFELGDRTLYVIYGNDVITYDAFTGALINKASLNGWKPTEDLFPQGRRNLRYASTFTKNDNLVLFIQGKALEFNRNAEVVTSKPIAARPNVPSCYFDPATVYKDTKGNYYAYESCYSAPGEKVAVIKLDSNFDLQWRTILGGEFNIIGPCNRGFYQSNDNYPVLIMNPMKGEVIARSYTYPGGWDCSSYLESIDMDSGHSISVTGQYDFTSEYANFMFLADGTKVANKKDRQPEVLTIDGARTVLGNYTSSGGSYWTNVFPYLANYYFSFPESTNSHQVASYTNNATFLMYIGDGMYVTLGHYTTWGTRVDSQWVPWLIKSAPSTNAFPERFRLGHFISKDEYGDAELNFSMKMLSTTYDTNDFGFSFRIQNLDNRYAVEATSTSVELVKYVGGNRTVLGSAAYPFKNDTNAVFKIKAIGKELTIFLNKVPIIETQDSSFTSGRFGPYSDKANINFWGISAKQASEMNIWSDQYAILDESGTDASAEVEYNNIVFNDPEGDPPTQGKYTWSVSHTPRFIHNQGISTLDGKTFSNAQLKFDKVGDYVVGLRAKDDPNPDYLSPDDTFDAYRKLSNMFTKKITVHRRPISDFSLAILADNTVEWTDRSHDPDRYESSTDYSTESTGIDYLATKGIMEKLFYYITPSGDYAAKKLVKPAEVGTYEVGMAVRDEYGAWSEYTVVTMDVTALPAPNTPPVPGFRTNVKSAFRGESITIVSEAYDKEDGDRTNLPHQYYIKNETTGSAEVFASDSRTSWDKAFNTIGLFTIRQIVEDSVGDASQFSKQVSIVNQIPSADIYIPGSTDQLNPTKLTLLRPAFKWNYSDADADSQAQYEMKIYRYGGILEYQSGIKSISDRFWTPGVDLPEKVNMYAMVRVFDGYDWSEWSEPKFFYIETNQPPTVDFDWKPKPLYEDDDIILLPKITDPDHDNLTVTYLVTDPSGAKQTFAYAASYPYVVAGPTIKANRAGSYTVQLTVSDGKAPPVTVSKLITVLPLTVSGKVMHTDEWDKRRKESNKKASGDENSPRAAQVFWAGERFMLSANTTDTDTATAANEVKVTMNGVTVSLTAANSAHTGWSGDMWQADFEKLPEGPLTFTFKAIYSNGAVKITPVTIVIAGNVQQTVGVHRRQ
ncbi:hypothetical protein A8990_111133 [Paenibacillus taihuensis]|uniref:Uncharacterized protein n=1 Tax=Paenibacillus taihuensis TaxID=1156355 RepID=A0A3D9SCK1_9BACL|nr:hypothetical protein [Paenibacillus taihuensis]REE86236.1 hypothetical protein A8990_111133 [Paenibacillus taihuensis]